ncbi:hypothetical protein ASPNIDRAFT_43323 [Aspergillus niger ATCC 1015]|uniref:Uncharacterized protein n=1 Tax=Aspergillus niger (strain ATCC 1015 / CBS 113.46 / FGSC A1144 / LSHB Ac4 / NCTC 3858a / NRRL 328 / USDA 3528.7) TaxID=380704 RepID=G3XMQ6_ASPNA|nr:hypothetical protein ASPNIDRAFT_43323 [Aspergillus niger ATCC 1015]
MDKAARSYNTPVVPVKWEFADSCAKKVSYASRYEDQPDGEVVQIVCLFNLGCNPSGDSVLAGEEKAAVQQDKPGGMVQEKTRRGRWVRKRDLGDSWPSVHARLSSALWGKGAITYDIVTSFRKEEEVRDKSYPRCYCKKPKLPFSRVAGLEVPQEGVQ